MLFLISESRCFCGDCRNSSTKPSTSQARGRCFSAKGNISQNFFRSSSSSEESSWILFSRSDKVHSFGPVSISPKNSFTLLDDNRVLMVVAFSSRPSLCVLNKICSKISIFQPHSPSTKGIGNTRTCWRLEIFPAECETEGSLGVHCVVIACSVEGSIVSFHRNSTTGWYVLSAG